MSGGWNGNLIRAGRMVSLGRLKSSEQIAGVEVRGRGGGLRFMRSDLKLSFAGSIRVINGSAVGGLRVAAGCSFELL